MQQLTLLKILKRQSIINCLFVESLLTCKKHLILLHKLSHYGIRDLVNFWFSSYLSNKKKFAAINGFDSGTQRF